MEAKVAKHHTALQRHAPAVAVVLKAFPRDIQIVTTALAFLMNVATGPGVAAMLPCAEAVAAALAAHPSDGPIVRHGLGALYGLALADTTGVVAQHVGAAVAAMTRCVHRRDVVLQGMCLLKRVSELPEAVDGLVMHIPAVVAAMTQHVSMKRIVDDAVSFLCAESCSPESMAVLAPHTAGLCALLDRYGDDGNLAGSVVGLCANIALSGEPMAPYVEAVKAALVRHVRDVDVAIGAVRFFAVLTRWEENMPVLRSAGVTRLARDALAKHRKGPHAGTVRQLTTVLLAQMGESQLPAVVPGFC